ncbi:hypothetical protein MRX96_012609 [Rhipicephalus microplus]
MVLHCFQEVGFSLRSSTAEEETAAAGAAAVTSLRQLWEAAGNASLVPRWLDYMDFALTHYMDFAPVDKDLVTTEELTSEELATSVSGKETIANSSSSHPEGDDMVAPQPVIYGVALAAVDALRQSLDQDHGPGQNPAQGRLRDRVPDHVQNQLPDLGLVHVHNLEVLLDQSRAVHLGPLLSPARKVSEQSVKSKDWPVPVLCFIFFSYLEVTFVTSSVVSETIK